MPPPPPTAPRAPRPPNARRHLSPLGVATFGHTRRRRGWQVNPHVLPFWAYVRGRPGRPSGGRQKSGGWRGGFLLGAMEVALKEDLRRHLMTLQRLELLLNLFGVDWSHLWLQPQDGSVTLSPGDIYFSDFLTAFDNLKSAERLSRMMREMERAVWEADANIQTRMRIEAALQEACEACGLSVEPPAAAPPSFAPSNCPRVSPATSRAGAPAASKPKSRSPTRLRQRR